MTTQYLRAYCAREAAAKDEPGSAIRFVASTEDVARDGLSIKAEGWQLDNYRRNPVVLWVHDYMGNKLPIGRGAPNIEGKQLLADVTFDQEDEFARQIESKYRRGYLNAVSVGWETLEMQPSQNPKVRGTVTKAELLDISAVPVPGDAKALAERQVRGLRQMLEEIENENGTRGDAPSEVASLWDGVASAMLALYRHAATVEDEDDHRAIFNKLEQIYRKLGRTAPEYKSQKDLAALSVS